MMNRKRENDGIAHDARGMHNTREREDERERARERERYTLSHSYETIQHVYLLVPTSQAYIKLSTARPQLLIGFGNN